MSDLVTVKNTYRTPLDYGRAQAALDQLAAAASLADAGLALERLGHSIGLPTYLMLDLAGTQALQALHLCHNLSSFADTDLILGTPQAQQLIDSALPVVINGDGTAPWPDELRFAVAMVMPRGATLCLAVFGREAGMLDAQQATELLGLAAMAASRLLDVLAGLSEPACPLSTRELECLCYAAAGVSAKETARLLSISHRTVEVYNARSRQRLGVDSTFAAAVAALRRDWLTHDQIEACQQLAISPHPCVAGPTSQR